MSDYYGLKAIGKRLGVSYNAVSRYLHDPKKPFLAYLRRPPGRSVRYVYTNDDLIRLWEVMRCQDTQKEFAGKRAARAKRKADAQTKLVKGKADDIHR